MTQHLDPLTVQRLAFVRLLYEQGVNQASQPDPLCATAVLPLHNAVEQFLRLAADHLHVTLPTSVNFADYWAQLERGLPAQTQLPSKNPMVRMNRLRVAFKHDGTVPSRTAVEQARADVTSFFTDATPLVFGIDFARIDLIDMVTRKETAQLLRDAQTHADAGDHVAAMAGLVIAFEDLIDHYSQRHRFDYDNPFSFGPTMRELRLRGSWHEVEEMRHLEEISRVTIPVQRAMRMIALGIDYRRYVQFEILTPRVNRYFDGSTRYTFTKTQASVTDQEYDASRRFVIESALQAANADAALDARTQRLPPTGEWQTPSERSWTGPAAPTP